MGALNELAHFLFPTSRPNNTVAALVTFSVFDHPVLFSIESLKPQFSSKLKMTEYFRVNRSDGVFDASLRQAYDKGYFSDVTVVAGSHADDSLSFFRAHKVILASVSDFFKNVLTAFETQANFANQNQTIFLKNVDPKKFQLLLNFFYESQVRVQAEDLKPFLELAKELGVKGLNVVNTAKNNNKSDEVKMMPNVAKKFKLDREKINEEEEEEEDSSIHVKEEELESLVDDEDHNDDEEERNKAAMPSFINEGSLKPLKDLSKYITLNDSGTSLCKSNCMTGNFAMLPIIRRKSEDIYKEVMID